MGMFIRWLVGAAALYLTIVIGQKCGLPITITPGVDGVGPLFIAVVVLSVVNAILRPIAKLITLPLTCMTFGLFSFVINAFMFWLVGHIVPGFHVDGFIAPLFGSIVMGLISGILNHVVLTDKENGWN